MICPKCGRPVEENAVICRGCDFILDTGFLGGDILDEEHQLRPGQGGVDPAVFNLADAVILGNIGDDTSSFETSDSGFHLKKDLQAARLYVSGRSQAVMSPDAVIGLIDASEKGVRLTPFEKHVLRFIDGKRPVETIRRQAGLDEAEVKTALATLADKGVVKVVGRALADAADFDVDTAPGVVNKKQPRRVRGTLVGAVVVVGDAADQAIDDAFRTQVRAPAPNGLGDLELSDDSAGVFSSSDEGLPSSAASQDVEAVESRGTDEILAGLGNSSSSLGSGMSKRQPTSSKNTVRPSAQKDAVNARARSPNTGKTGGRLVIADADASDGFDDFGDASNLATAVVQQPSISDESLPGADDVSADGPRRKGVFADGTNTGSKGAPRKPAPKASPPPEPPSNLSDLEDFDAPDLDNLADSRVEPRPVLPPEPRLSPKAAPPAMPSMSMSMSESSEPSSSGFSDREPSLNDDERAAMSGGVWDEATGRPRRQVGAAGMQSTNVKARGELSTSLSDLLDDSADGDSAAPTAPKHSPPQAAPQKLDDDEPTAFRPPPAPQAAPVVPAPSPASSSRPAPSPARPPISDPASIRPSEGWDDSTPRARGPQPAQNVRPAAKPTPPKPPPPAIVEPRGAADDLYPDADSGFEVSTEGQRPAAKLSDVSTSEFKRGQASPAPPPAPSPRPPPPPQLKQPAAPLKPAPAPPSGPPPPPPDDDDDGLDLTSPPSQESEQSVSDDRSDGTHDLPVSNASSAEILDSAMVIRPAAKPGPRAAIPGANLNAPRAADPPGSGSAGGSLGDDDDFMVDPDATMNLPARPKSVEQKVRGEVKAGPKAASGQVAAIPSGFSAAVDQQQGQPAKNRRPPTEDMRRKARNLMEQAQKDHAVGRIGAARMNAKLATIYDPENDEWKRILEAWEEKPKGSPATASSMSRPEYVQLYEQAQDLEDEGDVEGALELLQKGVRMAPNAAAFHNRIGVILAMRKREFDRAAAEIQKAISLEPDNPHYRNNLGKVMQKANKRKVG